MLKMLLHSLAICTVLCILVACDHEKPPNVPQRVYDGAKQILIADNVGPAVIGDPPLEIFPLVNDTPHEECRLRLVGFQLEDRTFGTVTREGNKLVFTPSASAAGKTATLKYQAESTFEIQAGPAVVESGEQTISIFIQGPILPPVAKPDSYQDRQLPDYEKYIVPKGQEVYLPVMLNDENTLAASLTNVTTPSNGGSASTDPTRNPGKIRFTSSTVGESTFSYTLMRGTQTSSAQVTVYVMPQARAFIVNNSDSELTIKANFDESITVQPRFNGADGSFPGRGILVFSVLPGQTTFRAETKNEKLTDYEIQSAPRTVSENQILTITFDQEPTPQLTVTGGGGASGPG